MLVEQAAPTGTVAAVYTNSEPPDKVGGRVEIREASATNTTAGALTLNVYVVPKGQAANAAHQVYSALALAANTTVHLAELIGVEISNGDSVQMLASGAGVEVQLAGDPVDPNRQ